MKLSGQELYEIHHRQALKRGIMLPMWSSVPSTSLTEESRQIWDATAAAVSSRPCPCAGNELHIGGSKVLDLHIVPQGGCE